MTTPAPPAPPSSTESAHARPLETSLLGKLCPKLEAAEAASDAWALNTAGLDLGLQRDPAGRHSIPDVEALGRPLLQMPTQCSA